MEGTSNSALSDLTIRVAGMGDAASLAGLMCELGYETRTAEMEMRLEPVMRSPAYQTLVAVSDGRVCGMIGTLCQHSYEHNDIGARIIAMVVTEKMRGKGVGSELLRAAEQDLMAKNVNRVALNSRFKREKAHEFYESHGYEKNGFRLVKTLGGLAD
jgi:GNAT superfamily N-acetyltransferase